MRERPLEQRNLGFLEQFQVPAVRSYIFTGLAALLVYYTLMSSRAGDLGALLTVVIAVPGLISRWIISPILFIILITYLLFDPGFGNLLDTMEGYRRGYSSGRGAVNRSDYFSDLLLAACILIYMMAHYRIMSFVYKSMPDDPAPRRKGQPEPDIPRRPYRLFGDRELAILFGIGAGCVAGGALLWLLISGYESGSRLGGNWGLSRSFSRFVVFMWSVGAGVILVGIVFRYLALRGMSWFEARLIVYDQFWLQTRREQERIYRWRDWYRKSDAKNKAKGEK
jgi:hypothetical protein